MAEDGDGQRYKNGQVKVNGFQRCMKIRTALTAETFASVLFSFSLRTESEPTKTLRNKKKENKYYELVKLSREQERIRFVS